MEQATQEESTDVLRNFYCSTMQEEVCPRFVFFPMTCVACICRSIQNIPGDWLELNRVQLEEITVAVNC
jgi:hypothetical protein